MRLRTLINVFMLILLLSPNTTAQSTAPVIWRIEFTTSPLPSRKTSPEKSRMGGIARWDQSHVLIYSLMSTGRLAIRKSQDSSEGAWEFLVKIVQLDTGKIDQSATLPAGSFSSEVALVTGGIVVSDPGRLTFYSRSFQKIDQDFVYTPLSQHWERALAGTRRREAGLIYATPDQQHLVLVDPDGHLSRIAVFDGKTLKIIFSERVNEINPRSVSVGNGGFFYTDMNYSDHVSFGTFEGPAREWEGFESFYQKEHGHEPVYIAPDTWLDILHTIAIVNIKQDRTLYHEHKNEGVYGAAAISPDKRFAAVFKDVRTGGRFDTELRRLGVAMLIVSVEVPASVCEIPVLPMPMHQFAMKFADDTRLLVLNDTSLSAYKLPCENKHS